MRLAYGTLSITVDVWALVRELDTELQIRFVYEWWDEILPYRPGVREVYVLLQQLGLEQPLERIADALRRAGWLKEETQAEPMVS